MRKPMSWPLEAAPPWPSLRWRRLFAALLRGASLQLDRLALFLIRRPPESAAPSMLEFHAEAGAPEGALYVDGTLVGRLHGVTRL